VHFSGQDEKLESKIPSFVPSLLALLLVVIVFSITLSPILASSLILKVKSNSMLLRGCGSNRAIDTKDKERETYFG
jgi:hypothetical protein